MDKIAIDLRNVTLQLPSYDIKARVNNLSTLGSLFSAGESSLSRHKTDCILNNINLQICVGEAVGIIGLNGSGKTTLLRVLSGIIKPTAGHVNISGKVLPILSLGSFFSPADSALNNVLLLSRIYGVADAELDDFTHCVIKFADLEESKFKPVSMFSRGMHSRLLVSFYYHLNADIRVVDEVVGAGDEKFNEKFKRFMEQSLTLDNVFVLATHNYNLMREFCSRAVLMHKGSIIFDGKVEKTLKEYRLLKGLK